MTRVPPEGMLGLVGASLALAVPYVRWLRRRHPGLTLETALARAQHLWLLLPAVALSPLAAFALEDAPLITLMLPLWVERHLSAIVWGSVTVVPSFGFAVAAVLGLATAPRRGWLAVGAGIAAVGAIEIIQRDRTAPIAASLEDWERDGIVFQSSPYTCVSASAANLLRHYGLAATERETARRLGATKAGMTPAELIYGLGELGLSCRRVIADRRDVRQLVTPAVLMLRDHAVLLVEVGQVEAVVIDPLVGRQVHRVTEPLSDWNGLAVHCVRAGSN